MNYQVLIYPVFLVLVFYFLLIRPQKKRESQINQMRNNLKVGDKIITIGGLYGKVVKIKDDKLTIELEGSGDKTLITVAKWGISSIDQSGKLESNKKEENKKDSTRKTTRAKKAEVEAASEEVQDNGGQDVKENSNETEAAVDNDIIDDSEEKQ
ncbi:MAG: preprotein translocase subunit YajC [Clostridiales bacterium]|nr:preprotein translocase subunit YajC [Clostridiales bacterium]